MKKIEHKFTFALKVKKKLHQEENKSGKETA